MLFDRVAQPSTKTRKTSDTKIFFAPSQGLIRNDNMAKPKALGAEVMDNWFPTPEGARMFKGSQRKATISGAVSGENDSFTKVLLHMDGADASTAFADANLGGSAHTWTAAGNAQIDTADSKFGGASGLFDGTGDYISTPDHANFVLGASNWTIDSWFKIAGGDGTVLNLAGQSDTAPQTAANTSFYVQRFSSGVMRFVVSDGSSLNTLDGINTYSTVAHTGWHHLEVTRSSNTVSMYVDGVLENSMAFTGTVPDCSTVLTVGTRNTAVATMWFGWLDEFRISVGAARHTAAFAVPTAAYAGNYAASPVTHLANYDAGAISKLFAADLTNIYDITTPADAAKPPAASVTGQTSGQWSHVNFTTSGGSFLVMVNGADSMEQFNGSAWAAITTVSAPISITNVATTTLSQTWKFKSRLFFVQGGTMSAWYLPTLSVGGAALELPLGSIFSKGGSLLFGFTFSMDAGLGPDDYCGFCTDQGEVAVYQGTDPNDALAWALAGVYTIGRPLGKNAHFKAGGDIGILTDDGAISAIEMLQKDRAGLQTSAITYPIEPLWKETVDARFSGILPFSCVLWPAKSMLVIGVPASGGQTRYAYAANTRHGAWGRRTGWDIRCLIVYGDSLFFGTRAGTILEGDVTGADEGVPYSAVAIPKFETFGRSEEKIANHCRMIARSNNPFTPQLFACTDYQVDIPTPLSADADESANVWGVARWGQFTWSSTSDSKQSRSSWQSVHDMGQALAPGIQITTGRTTAPDVELFALHLIFETGEVIG